MSINSTIFFPYAFDVDQLLGYEYDHNTTFTIDVKMKRKQFLNPTERMQYIKQYEQKKKTELCKTFTLTGQCKFGPECSFAHGIHEIKPKFHLHQKYKTKECSSFFNLGYCPYGERCQYLHEKQEYIKQKINNTNLNQNTILKKKKQYQISQFKKLNQLFNVKLILNSSEKRLNFFKNQFSINKDQLSDASTSDN